jgi:hypothetical protein
LGDKSDNIPKVFDKVGPVIAKKMYNDKSFLDSYFTKFPDSIK